MEENLALVARLRAAGCVFAEDEAELLSSAARSPAELDALVERRATGEPLEQVVGWAEFAGLRILVDPGVFVPRRRSEFLIQVAVALIRRHKVLTSPAASVSTVSPATSVSTAVATVIVDLCCGTGALGLAVAAEIGIGLGGIMPGAIELHSADLDPAAVACARLNVEPAGGRVYAGDLFDPLPPTLRGRVSLLICNAPYVPSAEIAFLPAEARDHESLAALDGGSDGLSVLRRAASEAPGWLANGGVLLVETSDRQAAEMASVMASAGLVARVHADEEYGATVVTGSARGG
jgi:release factor glutamine methyltransferase